ncbi:hypothetical protein ADUPG1_014024 [Aduncisulcus paluster]|uniref:Uncharacterized protein n=1 Tax=Aduncisulcus paluster TaxID=2918883 RepID=A0ABQ5KCQ7_9EUKA|nr:hypothetical protein ADUPG1_014024 [Aduncisulcus paluster]
MPAPYLESLDSLMWEKFLNAYDHYRSLGGKRYWPALCSAAALRIIMIISKISDFTLAKNRKEARAKVSAVYRGSSPQSISDQLKDTRMKPNLTMDSISEYIGAFDSKRSVDLDALDGKTFVRFFISGLFPSRLRVRVRTAIGPDSEDVDEAIRQSLEHGSALVHCLTEGTTVRRQIEAEKKRFGSSSFSEPQRQNGTNHQEELSATKGKPTFLKGVFCHKCKKEGHKSYNCPSGSKVDDKYLLEISSTSSSCLYATLSGYHAKPLTVQCILDTGASSSVISRRLVHLLGIKIQESTINEVFLADGSPIAVLGTVKIHTSLPGVDGMSMEFEEICLVIEMKGNKQVEFLIGKERILKNDLLDWLQELPEEDDVLIEDELNKEIVSPFDLDNGLWTCEILELHSKIDSLLQDYCMKIDKNKPASVPEFSLNFPEDRKPIALKCRKVPFHLQNEVRGWIDELLDSHFIVPSRSEFAAPIVLVRKPNGGLRLCCDYTLLNRITPNDEYPIPRQDMLFSALEGKSIFAALDLKNGYFNIAVDKKSRHQTAFITPWGLFEWNRMPFGLKSAPAHFQRCLNAIFKGMTPLKCLIYLDDILVFGSNEEEFLNHPKTHSDEHFQASVTFIRETTVCEEAISV